MYNAVPTTTDKKIIFKKPKGRAKVETFVRILLIFLTRIFRFVTSRKGDEVFFRPFSPTFFYKRLCFAIFNNCRIVGGPVTAFLRRNEPN